MANKPIAIDLLYDSIRLRFDDGKFDIDLMFEDQLMCTILKDKYPLSGSFTLHGLNGRIRVNNVEQAQKLLLNAESFGKPPKEEK